MHFGGFMSERSPQKIKKLREQADRLRFFSRSSLYIARTIALIFLGVAMCLLSFMSFARLANLYILVNEGMALRIECILQDGRLNALRNGWKPTSNMRLPCAYW